MIPENFILSTDYASPRNDASGTLQVTVPSNVNISSGSVWTTSQTLTIGTRGASVRSQIASSKDSNKFYVGAWQDRIRNGNFGTYDIFIVLSRLSPETIVITASIFNPYGGTLVGAVGAETFTAEVKTYLSAFEN